MSSWGRSLETSLRAASNDASALERFRESLDQAERAFSDEAQKIGLGAAFAKFGTADAVNMGGPNEAGFVIVAESGDLEDGLGSPIHDTPL